MDELFLFFVGKFKGNDEQYARAKLVVKFTLVELTAVLNSVVFYDLFNFHIPFSLFVGFGVVLFASLFLFRWISSLKVMAHLTIALMWAGFALGVSISGGIYSVLIPWLALMPIMGHLLIDNKSARLWFIVSAVSILFFMFFFKNPHAMVDPFGDRRAFVSYFVLVVVIFALTDLYARTEFKLRGKIKEGIEDLAASNVEITTQNENLMRQQDQLSAQRNFIEKQNILLRTQNKHIEAVNEQLANRVKEIFEKNAALERYWKELIELSKNKEVCFGGLDEALQRIVRVAADSLRIARVSVWRYDASRNSIQCMVLFNRNEGKFLVEQELLAADFPKYFEALLEETVIPADFAENNVHTYEFKDVYLRPHNIVSMMDAPFFLDGVLGGVLCCESQVERHWSPEDIIFAQALSDIVTLVFRTQQRRQYETRLRLQRREIEKANHELEQRVKERTQQLEDQNHQLAEYAFINSHILRGPVCRIIGLINLLDYDKEKERDLIQHLRMSSKELDDVVKKINVAISEGGHFNREQFGRLAEEFE